METKEFAIRLGVALLAGAAIGLERQIHRKSAGIRTNALVSIGAAVFTLISLSFLDHESADPTRIIGQIVTGIGFLGAGVILHQGVSIQGLTTAATIWCSAAMGSLAAMGYFKEVVVFGVAIIFVNIVFRLIDENVINRFRKEKNKEEDKEN
ncbi:MAG: MgtC/SapB family protein [Bacteroidales bacterium]|nr:MgtC/SapB family protein [Bacteroidales bacterium]